MTDSPFDPPPTPEGMTPLGGCWGTYTSAPLWRRVLLRQRVVVRCLSHEDPWITYAASLPDALRRLHFHGIGAHVPPGEVADATAIQVMPNDPAAGGFHD